MAYQGLPYFTLDAYDELYGSMADNAWLYDRDEPWLDEYFKGRTYRKTSGVEASLPTLAEGPDEQLDLINARMLYDSLRDLTPLQATNARLWSFLAHETYYSYAVKRWSGGKNWIKERMFCGSSPSTRTLERNAISRLWWFAHLTYDESSSDPYHLTKTLLTRQQVCMDLLDYSYTYDKTITLGLLEGLADFIDEIEPDGITKVWRSCVQYVNLYGASFCLDALDRDAIGDLSFNFLMDHYNGSEQED